MTLGVVRIENHCAQEMIWILYSVNPLREPVALGQLMDADAVVQKCLWALTWAPLSSSTKAVVPTDVSLTRASAVAGPALLVIMISRCTSASTIREL